MADQMSLFATDAEIAADATREANAEWTARFERAEWVAPYDCGLGPEGTVVNGWRCPACGEVEVNSYLLSINHGFDPEIRPVYIDENPFAMCTSMRLRRSQGRSTQ